jgi:hypothetical protein
MRHPVTWCVAALFLLLSNAVGFGQDTKEPSIQREAMKKLSFLAGQWKGESWTKFVPRQRSA